MTTATDKRRPEANREPRHRFAIADARQLPLADRSVDLVFCSPPYEAARSYDMDFALRGQDWVDWAVPCFMEHLRISKGLVAWVIEGQTRSFRWSATPALFMADLHRRGVHLRKPPAYHRVGIPGSGGPDWLRNDYEFVVCGTNGGRLPWSDNTAMGRPPKYGPGGVMSNRRRDGKRVTMHAPDGTRNGDLAPPRRGVAFPKKVNPGNFVGLDGKDAPDVVRCLVGGGKMGHPLAHNNEAPFSETLAEFFIRSFCPHGGTVCDPFSGSGTTVAVAAKTGRVGIGFDVRASQVELGRRRLADVLSDCGKSGGGGEA